MVTEKSLCIDLVGPELLILGLSLPHVYVPWGTHTGLSRFSTTGCHLIVISLPGISQD